MLTWLGLQVPWAGAWKTQGPSPLWSYHLHYHEHLAEAAWLASVESDTTLVRRIESDVLSWMVDCGGGGSPAWDSYPTSVRLASWLRILAWIGPSLSLEARLALRDGVSVHIATLDRRLEWHLDGNHLLRNAAAVALGALTQDGTDAPRLIVEALRRLDAIVREQILRDGWHYERTPSYHLRAWRDLLEVQRAAEAVGVAVSQAFRSRVEAMTDAIEGMWRSDGSLWQLNDSNQDYDVAPPERAGGTEGGETLSLKHCAQAHVVVARGPQRDALRIDLGEPAPAHQPGHAHAGALGFEFDLRGVPLFVDCGVSGYDGDALRSTLRGTGCHNTVRINGKDQSEMWATFRVASRSEVRYAEPVIHDGRVIVEASCRSYSTRFARHHRRFRWEPGSLEIVDVVEGGDGSSVEAFLHCAPGWRCTSEGEGTLRLSRGDARATLRVEAAAEISIHRGDAATGLGWYAAGFNRVEQIDSIRIRAAHYRGDRWVLRLESH